MKPKRQRDNKIPDIRQIRILTRFLEQLRIKNCYALGLKETKDYVEAKYDYGDGAEYGAFHKNHGKTHWVDSKDPNRIILIKVARFFFNRLHRLGIESAEDAVGLTKSKDFVLRRFPLGPNEY